MNTPNERPAPDKVIEDIIHNPGALDEHIRNTPYNDGTYPKSREEWLKEEQEEDDDE